MNNNRSVVSLWVYIEPSWKEEAKLGWVNFGTYKSVLQFLKQLINFWRINVNFPTHLKG